MKPNRGRALALLLLGFLPALLRFPAVGHGLPGTYVPDSHAVRQALGMARDRDPWPEVGKYSSYPYLMSYLLLPVFAAQYAAGRASGEWSGAEGYARTLMEEPGRAARPARLLSAAAGTATPALIFATARAAGMGAFGAWGAAFAVATSLLHAQFSVQERPWVLVAFFGALCLLFCVRHGRPREAGGGRPRDLLLAGAGAGLALAAHQAGLAFLGLCGLAWALAPAPAGERPLRRRMLLGCATVGACIATALLLGHGYYLRHGLVAGEQVVGGEAAGELLSIGGQAVRFGVSLDSLRRLSLALAGYEPALLLLGLGGLLPALRRRGTRAAALFALLYGAFFLSNPSDHVRYLLPLVLLLALPAGLAAEALWARGPAARAALVLLALVPTVQGARFVQLMGRADTRADALAACLALPPESRVVVDHYGPELPLSRAALERLAAWRPLRTREAARAERLALDPAAAPGVDAIEAGELFWTDPVTERYAVRPERADLGATPAEVLAHLGVTHVLLASRRPRDPGGSFLASALEGWPEHARFDPSAGGSAREAFLPTEMDFPLTALWSVERPGPRLELRVRP